MNRYIDNEITTLIKISTISMGGLGLIGRDSQEFCRLLEHLTNKQTTNYILNKRSVCCTQSA